MNVNIVICNLYPEVLNNGGSQGNMYVIERNCEWCGYNVTVECIPLGKRLSSTKYDFIFLGDVAPEAQGIMIKELKKYNGEALIEAVEREHELLSCGGSLPFLGKAMIKGEQVISPGVGLFPMQVKEQQERFVGDVLIKETLTGEAHWLVGFENHNWHIFLEDTVKALGKIHTGSGNNGNDGLEGICYKKAIGTNLQGAFLATNFWLVDFILQRILQKKEITISYPRLNRELEARAYKDAIDIARCRAKKK